MRTATRVIAAATRSSPECAASARIPRLPVVSPTTTLNAVSPIAAISEVRAADCFSRSLSTTSNVAAGGTKDGERFRPAHNAHSDSDELGYPSNTYDFSADCGRPAFVRRPPAFFVGNFLLPGGARLSPNFVAASGAPYNLIVGSDLNGDTISNDRPAFA